MSWISLAGSLAAVLFVAWLVGRLGLGGARPLDEPTARQLVEATFVGRRFGAVRLDRDGRGALVEGLDGTAALVRPHGDKWVARLLHPPIEARTDGETLIVAPNETMFGSTKLVLGAEEAGRWVARLKGSSDA